MSEHTQKVTSQNASLHYVLLRFVHNYQNEWTTFEKTFSRQNDISFCGCAIFRAGGSCREAHPLLHSVHTRHTRTLQTYLQKRTVVVCNFVTIYLPNRSMSFTLLWGQTLHFWARTQLFCNGHWCDWSKYINWWVVVHLHRTHWSCCVAELVSGIYKVCWVGKWIWALFIHKTADTFGESGAIAHLVYTPVRMLPVLCNFICASSTLVFQNIHKMDTICKCVWCVCERACIVSVLCHFASPSILLFCAVSFISLTHSTLFGYSFRLYYFYCYY